MIGSLSEQIAKWLKSKKIIEAEDVDVCGYGIFWLLNIIEFLLVSVILGTVLRILPGALAFFISFLLLRLFGGGFHMDTELKCQITSLAIITAFIIAVKMTAVQKASFFILLPLLPDKRKQWIYRHRCLLLSFFQTGQSRLSCTNCHQR